MKQTQTAPPPVLASLKDQQALWKRIADLRVAMMVTHDRDGSLAGRPVFSLRAEADGTLWYFVAAHGGIAEDLARNPHVNISFMDVGDDVYVWLRGTGTLVHDIDKVKELWSAVTGAWFPGGPEDPSLGLLQVKVQRGDYWDIESSKLVQFFSLAKATITKTPPAETGTHKKFAT